MIFADIRIDEKRWPWPWMLHNKIENVRVIDVPENANGGLDVDFLKDQLGKFDAAKGYIKYTRIVHKIKQRF